jgi:hypothetical protein
MLSRYPLMPAEEADQYIAQLEHEENIPLCHAVLGRIMPEQLDDDTRQTYYEFVRWSEDRTRRFRNERMRNRRSDQEDPIAARLLALRQRGVVPDEVLLLYGISGDLPDQQTYQSMSAEDRRSFWQDRMEQRFGRDWRRRFDNLPTILIKERRVHDWKKEGF